MIYLLTAAILVFIMVAAIAVAALHFFNDQDPDMHWNDTFATPPSVEGKCRHPYPSRYVKVIESNVNCETTVTACALCGKELTEPETDCR